MPFVTSSKTRPAYDVIIVGSGAAGGQSAYVLTAAGARVLMLEAGRNYDPISETPMFNPQLQAPLRGAGTPDKPFGFYDATVNGGWTVPKEPYMVRNHRRGNGWYEATDGDIWSTGQNFMWWRPRMLGGRTNHWARFSFRMGPYDFKPKSRDGLGMDWPITYEDLAPYYDKVEALIGVFGTNEGLENTPGSSPGILLPPPRPRANELLAKKFCARLGIPVIPAHVAILSQQQDADKIPAMLHPDNPAVARALADNMRTRLACFWATSCGRGS
jgi:choline dehydrogenase-like flavoprotein